MDILLLLTRVAAFVKRRFFYFNLGFLVENGR